MTVWLPTEVGAFPAGRFGLAVLESDQPIVAVVADIALAGGYDPSAYVGFAEGARESRFPRLLRNQRLADVPPEPRTATPSPQPTVIHTPRATHTPVRLGWQVWLPWAARQRP
jgi:hypothetical protein